MEDKTLKEALMLRRSSRDFAPTPLTKEHLSQILWAAYGVNRKEEGRRTVPSAYGIYPLVVFAVMEDAVYQYDPQKNALNLVVKGDYRKMTGHQDFLGTAPLTLLFFSDRDKMVLDNDFHNKNLHDNLERVEALNAGACTQNVYLYCASEGINVVERLLCDGERFKKLCGLKDSLHYVVAQTIGYPASGSDAAN